MWRPGLRVDILTLWNHAASIGNGTAGATNTAPASNMTSTKSLTCQRIAIGKEATSRPSMNCLGEMKLLTMPNYKRPLGASAMVIHIGYRKMNGR